MPHFVDEHTGLFKAFAETDCYQCTVLIAGGSSRLSDPGFLTIELLSNHDTEFKLSWRGRLWWIWRFLKGQPYVEIEFAKPDKVDKFIETLKEAREYTWPEREHSSS